MKKTHAIFMLVIIFFVTTIYSAQILWGAGTGSASQIFDGNVRMNTSGYSVTSYLI